MVREIEEAKAVDARRELDQLQGEFDTLTKAKALAESDREKKSLASQLFRLEERMDELEEHLVPLMKRRDELTKELEELKERIADAERLLADGEPLVKAEAVRQVCPQVFLHFGREPHGKRVFTPLLPAETEFISPSSISSLGRSSAPGP